MHTDPAAASAQVFELLRAAEKHDGPISFADPPAGIATLIERRFRQTEGRTLHFWQGEFHRYNGVHYELLPMADMRELLYGVAAPPIRKRNIDDALDALKALANLSNRVPSPSWITSDVDDPNPRALIPMRNGLLDISEETLLSPTPRLFVPYGLPFDYDDDPPVPERWLGFLDDLWNADPESISTLQEWFGYCLTPRTDKQKALLLISPRRGGKGTIGRVLVGLLGQRNVVSPTLASLGTQFGLQPLIGRVLALISDARLGSAADVSGVAENVLRVTGEDQVSIPRKFLPDYTATLPTRFMVLSNEIPRFADGSGALPSRFITLHSTASFYGKEDPGLTAKLLTELPGILSWALRGLRRLVARGHFVQPTSAAQVVEEMETLAAPVRAFLADRCSTSDPAAEIRCAHLFNEWRKWCSDNGREHPGNQQTFGRDLRAALPRLSVVQHRDEGKLERHYRGLKLGDTR